MGKRKKEIAGFSFDREPPEYSSAGDLASDSVEDLAAAATVAETTVLEAAGTAVVALEAATVLEAVTPLDPDVTKAEAAELLVPMAA